MTVPECRLLCVGLPTEAQSSAHVTEGFGSVRAALGRISALPCVAALVGEAAEDAGVLDAVSHLATVAPHLALVAVLDAPTVEREEALLAAGAQEVQSLEAIRRGELVAAVRRAVARQRRVALLGWQSVRDPLTGLLNRRGFEVAAEQVLRSSDRAGAPILALLLDVDDLKSLNDTKGHAAGDEALRDVASAIKGSLRASDVMGRIGGDEFAAVAAGADATHGEMLADRIARSLRAGAEGSRVGVSAGWAACRPGENKGVDDLLKAADAMLYDKKSRRPAG